MVIPHGMNRFKITAITALSAGFPVGTSVAGFVADNNGVAPKPDLFYGAFHGMVYHHMATPQFSILKPCDVMRSKTKCFFDSQETEC